MDMANDKTRQQRAHAGAERDMHVAHGDDNHRAEQAAEENGKAEDDIVGGVGRQQRRAVLGGNPLQRCLRSDQADDVATLQIQIMRERHRLAAVGAEARQLCQIDATQLLLLGLRQLAERPVGQAFARQHDVHGHRRDIEELGVIDLAEGGADDMHDRVATPGDGDDVAGRDARLRRRVDDLLAPPDAMDVGAARLHLQLGLAHGKADEGAAHGHAIAAQLDAPAHLDDVRAIAIEAHRQLELLRLRLEIDAQQPGPEIAAHEDDAESAEQVADRIGHDDVIDQNVALVLSDRQMADGIGGGADHRRFREAAGDQARGEAGVEVKDARHDIGGDESGHRHDDAEQGGGGALIADGAEKLRADRIADAEQEEQEED